MSPEGRWRLDPHVSVRRLGESSLAYHTGTGDTHLLAPLSGEILSILATTAENRGCTVRELAAEPSIRRLTTRGEAELTEAVWLLEEAGVVRALNAA